MKPLDQDQIQRLLHTLSKLENVKIFATDAVPENMILCSFKVLEVLAETKAGTDG